jgi:hypothetical protein
MYYFFEIPEELLKSGAQYEHLHADLISFATVAYELSIKYLV